jgi:hypothetical protein
MQVLLSEIIIPERRQRHEIGDIAELVTILSLLDIAGIQLVNPWVGLMLIAISAMSLILL